MAIVVWVSQSGNLNHRKVKFNMKITSINIKPVENAPEVGMVARISMTIDNAIALRGMRLLRRKDGTYGLGMAAQRQRNHPERINELYHPIVSECRKRMEEAAVAAYKEAQAEADKQPNYIYDIEDVELDKAMNITSIRFYPTKRPDARCRAFASVVLDDEFVLHQIHLVKLDNGTMLLGMPNFPAPKDGAEGGDRVNVYHPISAAVRTKLTETVLAEWEKFQAEKAEKTEKTEG